MNNQKNSNNTIKFIYANTGIDKWPDDLRVTKKKQLGAPINHVVNDIFKRKPQAFRPVTFYEFMKKKNHKRNFRDKYNFTCYHNNEIFQYVNDKVICIIRETNSDVLILSEFCEYLLPTLKSDNYFVQYYGPPGYTKGKVINPMTNEDLKKSKKTFALIKSSNDPTIHIRIPKNEKYNQNYLTVKDKKIQYTDETIGDNSDLHHGCIQIGKLVHKKNIIMIVNIHNRYYHTYEYVKALIRILHNYQKYDMIIVGDYNHFVFKSERSVNRYDTKIVEQNRMYLTLFLKLFGFEELDLQNVYKQYNDCPNKLYKHPNLQIHYRLSKYNVQIKNEIINCKINFNLSSHVIIPFTLSIKQFPIVIKPTLIPQQAHNLLKKYNNSFGDAVFLEKFYNALKQ